MRTKVLVLSLVGVTLSIASSGMSLAYFKSDDESTNIFTIGQIAVTPVTASIGRTYTDEMTGDPTSYTNAEIASNAADYTDYYDQHCANMLGDPSGANDTCNRYVFVQNTGNLPAYVRVRVMIPEDLVTADPGDQPIITLNYDDTSDEYVRTINGHVLCSTESTEYCNEYVFLRSAALAENTMTSSPVIDSITVNVIAATGGVGGGTSDSYADLTEGVKIYTEAIQAQGFADAVTAFNNY